MTAHALTWCISMYLVIGLKQSRGIRNGTMKLGVKKFVGVTVSWGKQYQLPFKLRC